MRTATMLLALAASAFLLHLAAADQTPPASTLGRFAGEAFPGASGYGRYARGGRWGQLMMVTNLADSGPGSLRACIEAEGPRVCIFRVGGVIRFTTERPIIKNPYLTVAGETAPGGIVLTHNGGPIGLTPLVVKDTHDVVVRNIRVRLDRRGKIRGSNSTFTIEGSRDVILDHVSGSWALDEGVGGHARNDSITVSSSIFAEGIPPHDKCALLGSDPPSPMRLSFINNLCAHNGDRNPDVNFRPGSCIEVINNVMYNAQSDFTEVWESNGGTPVSIVGNYYKAGPSTSKEARGIARQTVEASGVPKIYAASNQFEGAFRPLGEGVQEVLTTAPVCPLTVSPVSAAAAYEAVTSSAGAFPRDSVDLRVVAEVRGGKGRIRKKPGKIVPPAPVVTYVDADDDGMADAWEIARGLDPRRYDPWEDPDGNGWANLEEFLDFAQAQQLAGEPIR